MPGPSCKARYLTLHQPMKITIVLAFAAIMTGCLSALPPTVAIAPTPAFDPIAFFSGQTKGEGTLERRFGGSRKLSVQGRGTIGSDSALTLDQVITYADGGTETRRWVVTRVDPTHFNATLSDASGAVEAESDGNSFHLRYRIRSPHVYMEQWLVLSADRHSVENRAEVTVLGIPWYHLAERITKVE